MEHITYMLLNIYSCNQGGTLAHTRHINVSHLSIRLCASDIYHWDSPMLHSQSRIELRYHLWTLWREPTLVLIYLLDIEQPH